jgi:hypothetical protein
MPLHPFHVMAAEKSGFESFAQEQLLHSTEDHSSGQQKSWVQRRLPGWRLGCWLALVTVLSVLLVNVIFAVWAASSRPLQDGIGTLYEGGCDKSKSISTWVHLLINVLGTALLSGSNYCQLPSSTPVSHTALTSGRHAATQLSISTGHRQSTYIAEVARHWHSKRTKFPIHEPEEKDSLDSYWRK